MRLLTNLFEHQKTAVKKLEKIKVGALYLEMGTGKTRTAIELAYSRFQRDKIDKVLWLCPCSVKETIRRELGKHIQGYKGKFIVEGIESLSSSIKLNSRLLRLVEDERVMLIVDESNLVKNHLANRTKNIMRLSEYCPYRLILNGTPITKNEKDLYSQWYILDWRILGYKSFWSFSANHLEYDDFGRVKNILNPDYLVSKIAPYTYQIKKEECLDLPPKSYQTVYCNLTNEQEDHYTEVADLLLFEVDEMEPHTIYRLFSGLQNVISGLRVTTEGRMTTKPFFKDDLDNPRIQKLLDILNEDEKTIIFCKYTHEIKAITKIINDKYGDETAVEFYGELNQKTRQSNLNKFENESNFLVANKVCAGYGLNLQFCSYVIYYSNDWDYGTRSQSEDRVHRMGQNKNVHYVDVCCSHSLDERILKCLIKKENLVEDFKSEIENQKDKSVIDKYIYYTDRKGRSKISRIEKHEIKAIEELQEVQNG